MSEKITCGGDVHQATQTTETLGESQEIHLTEEFDLPEGVSHEKAIQILGFMSANLQNMGLGGGRFRSIHLSLKKDRKTNKHRIILTSYDEWECIY